ncbi:ATP-binding protein [Spongiactinospora sp. TRM90649]|uniref:ATP-binding protein n=1 Tax=Spongiactinospora sp. TRM90649 TaxID=3031114 RepID=UPI0023F7B120|nr:ATP-binding protein [Spongiactinospora sp. TRM90649]MDF5758196.1 ATP-binding protein [Spongiactinospora sp. TRM90649]
MDGVQRGRVVSESASATTKAGTAPGDSVFRLAGTMDQVSRARRLVSRALGSDHPLHDDCVLLTSEVATNAVVHSRSGRGGSFTLSVRYSANLVTISVQDDGSLDPPCTCKANVYASGGRGLPLLDALARRWGLSREAGSNRVWFELALDLVGLSSAPPNGKLFNR